MGRIQPSCASKSIPLAGPEISKATPILTLFRLLVLVNNFFCNFLTGLWRRNRRRSSSWHFWAYEGPYDRDNWSFGCWKTADAFLELGRRCCVLQIPSSREFHSA